MLVLSPPLPQITHDTVANKGSNEEVGDYCKEKGRERERENDKKEKNIIKPHFRSFDQIILSYDLHLPQYRS